MREIELKLLIDEEQERLLRSSPAAERAATGAATTRTLLSTYFDTAEGALQQRSGIALRLRHDGGGWVQTAKKAPGAIAQGLSTPVEDECALPGPRLDLARIADPVLRDEVIRLSRHGLTPVSETEFRRTARRLKGPRGAEVELAIDLGELRAGDAVAPIREAEFELKRGPAEDVFALARATFVRGPVRFSSRTKAERAAALGRGCPAFERPALVAPAPPRLEPDTTVEDAARAVFGEIQHRVAANLVAAVETDAADAPRQLARALDDLRAAIDAFRPAIGCAALDRLHGGAGETLAALGTGRQERDPWLCDRLTTPEVTALVIDLAAFVALRGWRAGAADPSRLSARLGDVVPGFVGPAN